MKIKQAETGDILKHPNGKFIVVGGGCGCVTDELHRRYSADYGCTDYVKVHPKPICENSKYTVSVINAPTMGKEYPVVLLLAETSGECNGYRHRFEISHYTVNVPFLVSSTDKRVGMFPVSWTIHSGQFWIKLQDALKNKEVIASFLTKNDVPLLHLAWGVEWMDIPKQ